MWIIVVTLPELGHGCSVTPDDQPMCTGPFADQVDATDYAQSQLSAYDPHVQVVAMHPVPDLIHG